MKRPALTHMHGFSLLELVISLALASTVATVATMTLRTASDQAVRIEDRNLVDAEAKVVFEQVVYRLRPIGGNGLSPRAALWVQGRTPAGQKTYGNMLLAFPSGEMPDVKPNTDSIVFVLPRQDFQPCVIRSRVGGSQQLSVSGQQCCVEDEVLNRPVLLVSPEGKVSARLLPVNKTCAAGSCTDGCSLTMDSAVTNLNAVETQLSASGEGFVGGQVTLESDRSALYVNTHNELILVRESGPSIERSVVAENILDLQISIGVDSNGDGLASLPSASLAPADDEWLWNGDDGNEAILGSAAVRMLGFGIVIKGDFSVPGQLRKVKLLDGEVHNSSQYIRGLYGQIALRNQPEFQ